jgi:hypothetical protein
MTFRRNQRNTTQEEGVHEDIAQLSILCNQRAQRVCAEYY